MIVRPVVDDRYRCTPETHIYGTLILKCRPYGSSGLDIICRDNDCHPGYSPHERYILIALVCSTVFTYCDAGMCRTDLDVKMRIADRISHLFEIPSGREHRK